LIEETPPVVVLVAVAGVVAVEGVVAVGPVVVVPVAIDGAER
jgi:hypothetical protein